MRLSKAGQPDYKPADQLKPAAHL